MYLDWKVGDRVQCVRVGEVDRARREGIILPVVGRVYTIRDMEPHDNPLAGICIRLRELVNGPHIEDGIEPSFWAGWFRKVQPRKTSIAIFEAMLHGNRSEVDA